MKIYEEFSVHSVLFCSGLTTLLGVIDIGDVQ